MSTSLALTPPVPSVSTDPPATFIGGVKYGSLFATSGLVGTIELGSVLSDPNGFIQTQMVVATQFSGAPGGLGSYGLTISGSYSNFFSQPIVATPPPAVSSGWDLYVDTSGNLATVTDLAAQLQDVAAACRLFLGELWYDTTQGIPYLPNVLGRAPPPLSFLSAQLQKAGLTVPGVAAITPRLFLRNRDLTGTLGVTNQQGQTGTLAVGGGGTVPWYVTAVSIQEP